MRDTAREPHKIPTVPSNCPLTEDEEDCLKKAEKQWDNYNQCKATVKAQIIMTIPEFITYWDTEAEHRQGNLGCHVCQVWKQITT